MQKLTQTIHLGLQIRKLIPKLTDWLTNWQIPKSMDSNLPMGWLTD